MANKSVYASFHYPDVTSRLKSLIAVVSGPGAAGRREVVAGHSGELADQDDGEPLCPLQTAQDEWRQNRNMVNFE